MLILIFLYIVLPFAQLYFFLTGQFGYGIMDVFNFAASIFALHWLLANVLLSSKLPLLQKTIPYDARIRFHIFSTAGIAAAVFYHAVYYFVLNAFISPVTWALMLILGAMLIIALFWIPVPGFRKIRSTVLTKLKYTEDPDYDRLKVFHRLFVLFLGMILLLHLLNAGLFYNALPVSSMMYWILYGGTFFIYLLSLSPLFKIRAEILTLEKNKGIIQINLKPDRFFRYHSGQFTFLEILNSGKKKEQHPFSFLSSPESKKNYNSGIYTVSLAIRALGDFTRNIENLSPGDMVQLNGAYGNFRPGKEKELCFIASGIGIVPVISLIKNLHATEDKRPIHLFMAVNHKDEIPERENILEIFSSMPGLKLNMMVYDEDQLRYSEKFFRKYIFNAEHMSYYICSSPGVRAIVLNALSSMGVKKSKIHYEAFSFG